MFKNYLKSGIRILRKQRSYALLSVFSLVVGLTCFILLMLFSQYELGYDSFHKNSGRIHLIGQTVPEWKIGGHDRFSSTSGALAPALKREFPEVEYAVRIKETDSPLVYLQNSVLGQGLYADQDFFKMFSYSLTSGNSPAALKDPFTIVLSESLAGKLFGRDDPIGKVVLHQNGREYQVTGVMKEAPRNSHLRFDYLLSFATMSSLRNDVETSWAILNYYNYVQLKEGAPAKDFEAKLKNVVAKYHEQNQKKRAYFLLPLRTLHLETGVHFSYSNPIDRKFITLLMGVAVLILIIACVNYVNLATARAKARSREVGVRKTFGADRRQLIRQFMGESYLLTFFSILVSLVFVRLLLPVFNRMTGIVLSGRIFTDGSTLLGLLGLGLAVGFLSGSYPALVLSALQPSNVFRKTLGSKPAGGRLAFRNVLVGFQFFATIVLLVGALVIQKQMRFIKNSDIGYQRKDILALRLWDRESRSRYPIIKKDLLKNPNIFAAAVSNVAPVRFTEVNNFKVENESGEMVDLPQVTNYFIDFDYFDLFNMKIVEGRKYSPEFLGEIENEVILNETAVRMAGLKNPIGKILARGKQRMRIIGVVKDIHFTSFKSKIGPLMFLYRPENINILFLKIADQNVKKTIASIAATIRKHAPDFVYDAASMDDIYNNLYPGELKLAGMLTGFTIVAILLASFGLFGLISFIVENRKKEIGIRKILGASVLTITGLLLRDLFILIGAAGLASIPAAYAFSQNWLQGFFYRTNLNIGVFVSAILVVLLIALSCVAEMMLRAAKENPVVGLKNI